MALFKAKPMDDVWFEPVTQRNESKQIFELLTEDLNSCIPN